MLCAGRAQNLWIQRQTKYCRLQSSAMRRWMSFAGLAEGRPSRPRGRPHVPRPRPDLERPSSLTKSRPHVVTLIHHKVLGSEPECRRIPRTGLCPCLIVYHLTIMHKRISRNLKAEIDINVPFQIFFGPVPPSPVIDATVRKGHFKISATFSFLKGVHSLCPTRRPRQMQFRVTDCFSRRRCCCCVGLFYLSKLTYTFCTISMVRIFCLDCWTNKLFFCFCLICTENSGAAELMCGKRRAC